ncbi:hypothetical protein GCM10009844_09040 [Nocardioides koreensis]|uniref:Peptidase metallopeptidase domain-containing protein n=1 Tax=Nocardioides koreensis TaxID=433651 RepID=A0ABN2ZBY9_9ACTN
MSRRPLLLLLGVLTLLTGALAPTGDAYAADEAVQVAWPVCPLVSGAPASLTVTGTDLTGPHRIYLREVLTAGAADLSTSEYLTPEQPVVTLPLPTVGPGSHEFAVEVATGADDGTTLAAEVLDCRVLRRPTVVAATFPTGTVAAGAKALVTGTVTGLPGRTVQLQVRTNDGWAALGRPARTATDGSFAVHAPTWWVHRTTMRVLAPVTDQDRAATSATTGTMTVARPYRPRAGTAWTPLDRHHPRWNPCDVITYRVNRDRMPAHGMADLREGLRRVSQATGLRFEHVGGTAFVPLRRGHEQARIRNADFAVAWAAPRQVPWLAGNVIGVGGGSWSSSGGGPAGFTYGFIVLDATARLRPGYAPHRYTWGSLVLHELGHAIGLGHVSDRRQIMVSGLQPVEAQYAAGDLRGLAAVGAGQGCFTSSPSVTAKRLAPGSNRSPAPIVAVADRS